MKLIPIPHANLDAPIFSGCEGQEDAVVTYINPDNILSIQAGCGGSIVRFAFNPSSLMLPHPPAVLVAHIKKIQEGSSEKK